MADYDAELHIQTHTIAENGKKAPYTPRMTGYEEAFFPLENQEEKASRVALRASRASLLKRTFFPRVPHSGGTSVSSAGFLFDYF